MSHILLITHLDDGPDVEEYPSEIQLQEAIENYDLGLDTYGT